MNITENLPDFIEVVDEDASSVAALATETPNTQLDDGLEDNSDDVVEKVVAKSADDEDREAWELRKAAERELMAERYNESQAQIQLLNKKLQELEQAQIARPDYNNGLDHKLQAKKNELAMARQEYLNAKNTFNPQAEAEAMEKFGNIQWELKELEKQATSNVAQTAQSPQQNQVQPQNIAYNPNEKAFNKLREFVSKPENSWMNNAFDPNLTPVTQEGVIANNLFAKLSSEGHPGTQAFWNLYQHELKKALPSKYAQRYGKGSPSVAAASNAPAPVAKKAEATLAPWEKNMINKLAKDKDSEKRIAQMLKKSVPHGMGTVMFELGA